MYRQTKNKKSQLFKSTNFSIHRRGKISRLRSRTTCARCKCERLSGRNKNKVDHFHRSRGGQKIFELLISSRSSLNCQNYLTHKKAVCLLKVITKRKQASSSKVNHRPYISRARGGRTRVMLQVSKTSKRVHSLINQIKWKASKAQV